MIGWRDYQSYFFTSGFVIVNWKAIYYSKKGNSKQRQQNYHSQHPIEQWHYPQFPPLQRWKFPRSANAAF